MKTGVKKMPNHEKIVIPVKVIIASDGNDNRKGRRRRNKIR